MNNIKKWLDILEVSQKQAYIFASNKLKDNVMNSGRIAYLTRDEKADEPIMFLKEDFFTESVKEYVNENKLDQRADNIYKTEKCFIYAGGGHTVLQFSKPENAFLFNKIITEKVNRLVPDVELFTAVMQYDNSLNQSENLNALARRLEDKKARRISSFYQKSFGVEAFDVNTQKPVFQVASEKQQKQLDHEVRSRIDFLDKKLIPEGYCPVWAFDQLGMSRDEKSFIAIVHIDGNSMGARVNSFYQVNAGEDWGSFRTAIRNFSQAIDSDFQKAFAAMNQRIAAAIAEGRLNDLDLQKDEAGRTFFPVRRIVSSGDDICFACDGRIGIEAAAIFLEELSKLTNKCDEKHYAACAGVAIVHVKYPFFSAYNLAEQLCANAKKYAASLSPADNGACISAIDWHMEGGECPDELSNIRKHYLNQDGIRLTMRPYVVTVSSNNLKKQLKNSQYPRTYANFRKLYQVLTDKQNGLDDVRSRLKEMRSYLKEGDAAARYYVRFHKLSSLLLESHYVFETEAEREERAERKPGEMQTDFSNFLYLKERSPNGKENEAVRYAILFDAAEIMDTYILLGQGGIKK